VNNNAAAVLLALAGLARGREVVVSRGELVEIGGSFRVPEILEQAGVQLREVGTTNRTHPRDYENAIADSTAALLKVHRSNFEQRGFVTEVDLAALVEIGARHALPVIDDLGSGTLLDLRSACLPEDAYVPSRLAAGADLVCFSGDKLLGGPQAGLILGRADAVDALRRNPLARALRVDKLDLAALHATLALLLEGRRQEIPVVRMLLEPVEKLSERARGLAASLAGVAGDRLVVEVEPVSAAVGGGSLPGFELPSAAVVLSGAAPGADALAARLRSAPLPVLVRTREDRVWIDTRTLLEGEEEAVQAALEHALSVD
jgi:L-seryl-tRNA(Ser) seleniumtransferase